MSIPQQRPPGHDPIEGGRAERRRNRMLRRLDRLEEQFLNVQDELLRARKENRRLRARLAELGRE
jgi:hypothetical protein